MNTALARDIDYSEDKIRYDAACRNILADKHILAWILKGTMTEYKDNTIEEILKCIEPPEIATARVEDTNAPERVVGISDSDKDLFEGDIFYDIRFSVSTKDTLSNLIINIEEQNDFYPGYSYIKKSNILLWAYDFGAKRYNIFGSRLWQAPKSCFYLDLP